MKQNQKPPKKIALVEEATSIASSARVSTRREKRDRSSDGVLEQRPTSVPRLEFSSAVQQAWDILLARGMGPDQVERLKSQATAGSSNAQNDSLGRMQHGMETPSPRHYSSHTKEDFNWVQNSSTSLSRAARPTVAHDQVLDRGTPQADNSVVQNKEQRLMGLVSQLINEFRSSSSTKPLPSHSTASIRPQNSDEEQFLQLDS